MTTSSSLSTSAILDRLSLIRTSRLRLPSQVSQLGQQLVRSGWTNKDTDQGTLSLSLPFPSIELIGVGER